MNYVYENTFGNLYAEGKSIQELMGIFGRNRIMIIE